jgi:hypothetical protein
VHDLAHPGVNNAFLVRTRAPTAVTYNDRRYACTGGGGVGGVECMQPAVWGMSSVPCSLHFALPSCVLPCW